MSHIISRWEDLPHEIWFPIFKTLPLKSQVSLACTCTQLYARSLDPFLNNKEKRVLWYLARSKPLPSLLARSIQKLTIPWNFYLGEDAFFLEQLLKMENLKTLVLRQNCKKELILDVIFFKKLEKLYIPPHFFFPPHFLTTDDYGRELLDCAITSGNRKVTKCLIDQCLTANYGRLPQEVLSSWVSLAQEHHNRKMIRMLVKKGGIGREFITTSRLSCHPLDFMRFSYGLHLRIQSIAENALINLFTVLAQDRNILSLELQSDFLSIEPFFNTLLRGIGRALRNNTTLRVLDLSSFSSITFSIITLFLQCRSLAVLKLSFPAFTWKDKSQRNLLHWTVELGNRRLTKFFLSQQVALSDKDNQGHTPLDLAYQRAKRKEIKYSEDKIICLLEKTKAQKLSLAFGKRDWEKYLGAIGKEPPLPPDILTILEGPCPIFPNQLVAETHLLILIPQFVNGKPYTLDSLGDTFRTALIDQKKIGAGFTREALHYDGSNLKEDIGGIPEGRSRWILLSKTTLPNSEDVSFNTSEQEACIDIWKKQLEKV
eukprot:Opistho-1_new@64050